ncbi:multicopper oxidase domain-containing protein [Legionella jordanis]|uniref:Copper efflux ATPase n=1 Tax=Legionella jordanis TaxID=456 RepID=A0A0W0VGH2_9GAMM|nr:copper efflux ATPase [Legionella jordanis]RMW99847.1 copper oxidase [Legionella jordanis]VEH12897.1 copper efflux ATPase [Legionella jordanis]HAT8714849.1 multicopper oxidase domain-containing protein [Legionella jordanis]
MKKLFIILLFGLAINFPIVSFSTPVKTQIIDLTVGYKEVQFTGQRRLAVAVNNQIPGPTLHFKEGERVQINVHNHLNKGTTIHWHGLLVPWQMDGVEHVTQQAIPPGGVFHYEFTPLQAGTYWYHAHSDAQEQDGLYGAIIIDPLSKPDYRYNKDFVIVLSDWSNGGGEQVFANLKKDGDYYAPRFALQPSLMKFLHDYRQASREERKLLIADYRSMQQMRMSIYDISDVAYDAYLLNGKTSADPWQASVTVGDVIRLRFIGAGGSTIYRVKIPGAKMQVVHVQGNDVTPHNVDDFSIAPGETEDVLVKVKDHRPYIIYAESIDTIGKAMGALTTKPKQFVNYQDIIPFPEPKPVTRDMMANMMASMSHGDSMGSKPRATIHSNPSMLRTADHSHHKGDSAKSHQSAGASQSVKHSTPSMTGQKTHHNMNMHSAHPDKIKAGINVSKSMGNQSMPMHSMTMPTEPTLVGDRFTGFNAKAAKIKTIGTKYQSLKAAVKTNNPAKAVDSVIRMELFGYMDRYLWMINGLPEYRAKPILIEPGKRYRIIFTNNSMMRHPMHLHGHWFILRNGHGSHDPLLHTIEVPPGATAVADFDSDASGQWFFHCHHLFHMMAGMARVFQYETIIEVAAGQMKPERDISRSAYVNRPIVRVDEQIPLDRSLIPHPIGHPQGFFFANFLEVDADPFHNVQELTFRGLYGGDYQKLELFVNDAELNQGSVEDADIDIFYWHLLSQFWAIKGGVNYFNQPARSPYWQPGIGIEGLMPYFIETDLRTYYYNGSFKLDLELSRATQISNNLFIETAVRSILATKTVTRAELGNGLNQMRYTLRPFYRVMPGLGIYTKLEYDQYYGAFRKILNHSGESSSETTVSFGVAAIF